ncbi:MAG: adenylate kinase [Acidobacteriota bacterium]
MLRMVVLGNSGGGKSGLARRLAPSLGLPCFDLDAILWRPAWQLAPAEVYQAEHSRLIAEEGWLLDGLGLPDSIPSRLARATDVVLIDLPLWMHFWLAAERQVEWAAGRLEHPPGGFSEAPPLHGLFKTIWENDRDLMPALRSLVAAEEGRGKRVFRLTTIEERDAFTARLGR